MKINKNKTVLMLSLATMLLMPAIAFVTNKITSSDNTFALTYSIPDGYTTFTDANLYDCVAKEYKSNHPDVDISEGLTDEQLQQIAQLFCDSKGITNAKGIEKMTALTKLYLYNNQLTTINLSSNTALTNLDLSHNQLASLDVSNNTALVKLSSYSNQLTTINLSSNTALTSLNLYKNQLTFIDLSHNTALTDLELRFNKLDSIDLSSNTLLRYLDLSSNNISSINLSENILLGAFKATSNKLASINLPNSDQLKLLELSSNQLASIDLSNNTALTNLELDSNQLTSIDLSNNTDLVSLFINNNQLTFIDFSEHADLNNLKIDDDVLLITNAIVQKQGNAYIYDFNNLNFITDGEHGRKSGNYGGHWHSYGSDNYTFSIEETSYMTYDEPNMLLTVTNLAETNGYVQVVGMKDGTLAYDRSYKIKLFDIYTLSFDMNGDTDSIDNLTCNTLITGNSCTIATPSTTPTRDGYTFLGWADTANANTAEYASGDSVTLTADKTIYAIWAKNNTGGNNTGGSTNQNGNTGNQNNSQTNTNQNTTSQTNTNQSTEKSTNTETDEEDIDIPDTGKSTKENNSAFATIILLPGFTITLLTIIVHRARAKRKTNHIIDSYIV